jgi:hypothetical protein
MEICQAGMFHNETRHLCKFLANRIDSMRIPGAKPYTRDQFSGRDRRDGSGSALCSAAVGVQRNLFADLVGWKE